MCASKRVPCSFRPTGPHGAGMSRLGALGHVPSRNLPGLLMIRVLPGVDPLTDLAVPIEVTRIRLPDV
jgi:hypothetical protein